MIRAKGFSLLELMVVLVVSTLLLTLAMPAYDGYTSRAKVTRAMGDIAALSLEIEQFRLKNRDRVPMMLDELGVDIPLDPWQQPYEYLNIIDAGSGKGDFRKDGKLNPLNTDYDLYSMGKDGQTSTAFTSAAGRDDVVRANNGGYLGIAEGY